MRCLSIEADRMGPIEQALMGRRSMEAALVDLRATHRRRPSFELDRMIQNLEAEIAIRKQVRSGVTAEGGQFPNA